MNRKYVGQGKVVLIAGGGKVYTDIAARFCNSEKELEDIIASPYDKNIVKNILESGHLAATEFDNFIFGIEGYSRVTEVQLVRKRMASYLIKSGRGEKNGRRSFDVVHPRNLEEFNYKMHLWSSDLFLDEECTIPLDSLFVENYDDSSVLKTALSLYKPVNSRTILHMIEDWYNEGVKQNIPEEDLRYLKPQATEFKAIVSMNKHALHDWFKIRLCKNAQDEIRDLALKMFQECKKASPDLFKGDGPSCVVLGYCPENDRMHPDCKGKFYTKNEAMKILQNKKFTDRKIYE